MVRPGRPSLAAAPASCSRFNVVGRTISSSSAHHAIDRHRRLLRRNWPAWRWRRNIVHALDYLTASNRKDPCDTWSPISTGIQCQTARTSW